MNEGLSEEAALVNRCECINKSFEQLKVYGSYEEARKQAGAGVECGGCVPYLKLAFATGETAFAIDDPRLKGFR
ncbi:MAG: hypothetical protein RQ867_10675 [Mariprofundaceae bacterium]|nr:hypothetical protein [Mariprofundaceae bacterium]